ncbi:hypothetical protein HDU96_008381 [Phlyctochytrium bullatum]|nr:hypothetical protein HDU96_008381 [Phlyctochytrium bullatum]
MAVSPRTRVLTHALLVITLLALLLTHPAAATNVAVSGLASNVDDCKRIHHQAASACQNAKFAAKTEDECLKFNSVFLETCANAVHFKTAGPFPYDFSFPMRPKRRPMHRRHHAIVPRDL